MTPRISRLILAIGLWFALPFYAQAGVYKCTDAKNRVFYQDRPCQELNTERLPSHLAQQLGGQDNQRPFLWKTSSEKGTAYLFGSLHFGTQDMYPLPESVAKAFAASDVLVVEADPKNQENGGAAGKIAQAGLYGEGADLEDHVKPATWQKLSSIAKNLGLPEETLHRQKPWLAILTLTGLMYKQAGLSPELGIDQNFIKEAGTRKPILELESVDQQVKLFDALAAQEQEQMLIQSLAEFERGPDLVKSMLDAWRKGDVEAMDIIVRQSFSNDAVSEKLYKLMFSDRNAAMANKLEELMADGRTYFIVVGAGHLGGDQGILKLLENKGYKVTQP
ncbi:TraB/GumN family protein [Methylococcus sp. EFPC2]|uniref:TraB/GumN family protein n=1 Tax=Methylococcus sp. EFPC2 TaxID=2812648 RepID=UPI0019681499|nr:TraB/GumN family protein [Methylococcus sp. EFPC2]QSA95733.1 TraB/GumN family protein [Methylococcus sp. EFPC2]